jgi:protein-tyrosine phosphatase
VTSILVICTGNICRSPMAEGFLRRLLEARSEGERIDVSSAGTSGWDGSPAMPESVEAAGGRHTDITEHRARRLSRGMVESADLILGMTGEHRDRAGWMVPEAASRSFTLKELVRLLEALPPETDGGSGLRERIAAADELRRSGFTGNPKDDDVIDPLGLPASTYRAVAWELDDWSERLVRGLLGRAEEPAASRAPGD